MKLTKFMREAFVRAAMQDVPSVDYNEQARELVQKAAKELLPPTIKKLVKAGGPELPYIRTATLNMPGRLNDVAVYCRDQYPHFDMLPPDVQIQVREMEAAAKTQGEQRRDLAHKLEAAAASVTTRKALAELLPEFERYLPIDTPAACKTLPAIANVVADFSKAGWPKNKKTS